MRFHVIVSLETKDLYLVRDTAGLGFLDAVYLSTSPHRTKEEVGESVIPAVVKMARVEYPDLRMIVLLPVEEK